MVKTQNLQIHCRGLSITESIQTYVEDQFAHLTRFFQRQPIISCHVTLELLNHRCGEVATYRTLIEMTIPGKRLVVGGERGREIPHQNAFAALQAAFAAMERRLTAHAQRLRQEVKHHEPSSIYATVKQVFPDEGYGFLLTDDGREVYFNENAIIDADFDHIDVGDNVRFCEEMGEQGPQASTLRVVRHRSRTPTEESIAR